MTEERSDCEDQLESERNDWLDGSSGGKELPRDENDEADESEVEELELNSSEEDEEEEDMAGKKAGGELYLKKRMR